MLATEKTADLTTEKAEPLKSDIAPTPHIITLLVSTFKNNEYNVQKIGLIFSAITEATWAEVIHRIRFLLQLSPADIIELTCSYYDAKEKVKIGETEKIMKTIFSKSTKDAQPTDEEWQEVTRNCSDFEVHIIRASAASARS